MHIKAHDFDLVNAPRETEMLAAQRLHCEPQFRLVRHGHLFT